MIQTSLKQLLMEQFNIPITPAQCQEMVKICQRYEIRGDNMAAFNTPYLGINKAYFLPKDADAVFDCFNVDPIQFQNVCRKCTSISSTWNVTGNNYNLFTVWLVYLLGHTKLPEKTIQETRTALLKLLHYKFFTGKVAVMFKHGVNAGVMQYTIDHLSDKSDIKKQETSTWRLVIEQHVRDVLGTTSIHRQTVATFQPDKAVVYLLSDMHTRLSSKIKNIAEEYYRNHAAGNSVSTTSLLGTNDDGEKVLGDLKATLDTVISSIQQQVLNVNTFVNFNHVKLASGIANVRPELLRQALVYFSNVALNQYKSQQGDEVQKTKDGELYIGYRRLIYELVQKSYRRAALVGANMDSNISILQKVRDAFRASRITDQSILSIKNSVDYFISEGLKVTREATLIAVRTAFILYLIILTFNKK